jgi:hypothetical protein
MGIKRFLTPSKTEPLSLYPLHLKMHDLAGIRNAFRQGID